jgi:hypothetical protein
MPGGLYLLRLQVQVSVYWCKLVGHAYPYKQKMGNGFLLSSGQRAGPTRRDVGGISIL